MVPLPSKWLIEFCEPIDTTGYVDVERRPDPFE